MGQCLKYVYSNIKRNQAKIYFMIFSFIATTVLIGFRQENFRFIPVMWAEDGAIHIQRAIEYGWQSLFQTYAGYYIVAQQIIVCFWYTVFKTVNNITFLWWCVGYTCLAINSLCISYFISDRFEWLVEDRRFRFSACAVVSIMPWASGNNEMLMHVTNINWWMFWMCFLVSLDLLCNKQMSEIKWWEVILFSLTALSSGMAPLILAVDILIAIRTFISSRGGERNTYSCSAKLTLVALACLLQVSTIFTGPRLSSMEWSLPERIWILLKNFTLLPPFELAGMQGTDPTIPFVAGIIFWIVLIVISKIDLWVVLYSFGFSFAYWCLASAVCPTIESLKQMGIQGGVRYLFVQYLVWGLMLSICITRLWKSCIVCQKYTAAMLSIALFVLLASRYNVTVPGGAEFSRYYHQYADYYDRSGSDYIVIPVPPWRPWGMWVPADLSAQIDPLDGGLLAIDYVDGQGTSTAITISNDDTYMLGWAATEDGSAYKGIFIKCNNVYYPSELLPRPDVADYLDSQETELGFKAYIPKTLFSENGTTVEVIGVDSAGELHYMTQNLNMTVT